MIIKRFESYSEDEGILQDIFSGLEDKVDISIEVQKTFLNPKWNTNVHWNGSNRIPSFHDIFSNTHPIFHDNVSKLLPDSEIINIRRRWSVGHGYRDIPFYIVTLKFKKNYFLVADPSSYVDMASKFGFIQVYDSRSKFPSFNGDYITRALVFYHENYL